MKPSIHKLAALLLTLPCSAIIADEMTQTVTFKNTGGVLIESFNDEEAMRYTKSTLPAVCSSVKTPPFTDQNKRQPSADIVGTWKMKQGEGAEADMAMAFPGDSFLVIKATGEVNYYFHQKADGKEKAYCETEGSQELDGNSLTFKFDEMPGEPDMDLDVKLSQLKLTNMDKQLAVLSVYSVDKDMSWVNASLYDRTTTMPAACDVQAKSPSSEASNDNPGSNLVGTWEYKEAADAFTITSGNDQESQISFNEYFVVTADGFVLQAFNSKEDGVNKCEVEYLGEVVNDYFKQ